MSSHPVATARSTSTGIQALLPHRYPFLLVDRVVELEPNKRVLAYKNVTINEPFFQGHFPGHPVMPGVLVIEALAQAGGLLTQLATGPATATGKLFYLVKIDNAQVLADGRAGRPAGARGRAQAHDPQHGACTSGIARVDGEQVACAEILCAEVKAAEHGHCRTRIHPSAVVDAGARLGAGVQRRRVLLHRRRRRDRRRHHASARTAASRARPASAATTASTATAAHRRRPAGQEVRRRARRAGDRRPQHRSASSSPSTAAPAAAAASPASATTTGSWPTRTSRTTASSATTACSPTTPRWPATSPSATT